MIFTKTHWIPLKTTRKPNGSENWKILIKGKKQVFNLSLLHKLYSRILSVDNRFLQFLSKNIQLKREKGKIEIKTSPFGKLLVKSWIKAVIVNGC